MSNDRYYSHQHSQAGEQFTGNENIRPVSSMFTPVTGSLGLAEARSDQNTSIAVVSQPMMRAYEKPKRRVGDKGQVLCAAENAKGKPCKAFPIKDSEYCTGHARQKGLIPKWTKHANGDTD